MSQGIYRADAHAARLLTVAQDEIDQAARLGGEEQVIVFRCLETDMSREELGAPS